MNPFGIKISFPVQQIQEIRDRLSGIKNGFPDAVRMALVEVLRKSRVRISRKIREVVNLTKAKVDAQIKVKNPSKGDLSGEVTTNRKSTPLAEFMTSAKVMRSYNQRKTVTVKVRKQNQLSKYPDALPNAFVTTTPNSPHVGVFERVKGVKRVMKSGTMRGHVREVIRRMYGPTAVGVFSASKNGEGKLLELEQFDLSKDFSKAIKSKADYLVSKKK